MRRNWWNRFERSTGGRNPIPHRSSGTLFLPTARRLHDTDAYSPRASPKQSAALCYNQDQYATNYLRESKYREEYRPVPLRRLHEGREAPLRAPPHVHVEGRGDGLRRPQGARPEPRVSRGVLQLAEGRAAGAHRRGDFEVRLREGRGSGRDLASQEGRQRGDRNGLRPRGRVD